MTWRKHVYNFIVVSILTRSREVCKGRVLWSNGVARSRELENSEFIQLVESLYTEMTHCFCLIFATESYEITGVSWVIIFLFTFPSSRSTTKSANFKLDAIGRIWTHGYSNKNQTYSVGALRWIIGAHGLYENKNTKSTHHHAQLLHFANLKLRVLESANGVETSVLLKNIGGKNHIWLLFSPCGARLAIGCNEQSNLLVID
jgi:hypothetical protein